MKKLLLTICTVLCGLAVNAQTVDWAGTYTVVTREPFFYTETAESYGITLPETFQLEIARQDDKFVITKFMGHDLTQSHDGIIEIELDANKETVCYIPTKRHLITSEYYERTEVLDEGEETQRDTLITGYKGLALCGNNLTNDPIKVTRQSDGQIKMATFTLGYRTDKGGTVPLGWFDKNVPENGGDPDEEVVSYAWAGTYLVTSQGSYSMAADFECPDAFLMTIEEDMWNPGSYIITEFMGHDDLAFTNFMYGGLPLTLDEENGDVSYLPVAPGQNLIATRDAMSYFALTDAFGMGTEKVALTHNSADDTFTIDMFSINTYGYAEDFMPETIAMFFGATAVKGDREALQTQLDEIIKQNEMASVESIQTEIVQTDYFDLHGNRLVAPQKGINIVRTTRSDGKVISRKVVVK